MSNDTHLPTAPHKKPVDDNDPVQPNHQTPERDEQHKLRAPKAGGRMPSRAAPRETWNS